MKRKTKFFLFVIFLATSLLITVFSSYYGLNQSYFENIVSSNYILSAVIYFVLFVGLTTFSFSVSVMTSIGALFFSIYLTIILVILGILGSSVADFYISRKLGKDYVRNYLEKRGGKIEKFDEIIEKDTFKTILVLSAIFFIPPTIPNLLGGIMKINLKNYIIATFFGNITNTIFTVLLINSFVYSNLTEFYISVVGLVLTTAIAIFFYRKEILKILKISFPRISRFLIKNDDLI